MKNKASSIASVIVVIAIIIILGILNVEYDIGSGKDAYFTFTDSRGDVVSLEKKPERVAVLFSSLAEIWSLSGGEISITVGESVERGICDDQVVLVDAGAGKTINNEALLLAEPDFVILSADIPAQTKTAELLKKSGIPVAALRVDSFEDYLSILKALSKINADGEAFSVYGERVESEVKEVIQGAKEEKIGDKILFIRSGASGSSAKAKKAQDNFAAKMLEELGCFNIADNAPILLDGLSVEEILKENPEHIFVSLMGDEDAAKAYMTSVFADEIWQSVEAVKQGNIHFLPKDLFQFKPCARWADAYRYLYRVLGGSIE